MPETLHSCAPTFGGTKKEGDESPSSMYSSFPVPVLFNLVKFLKDIVIQHFNICPLHA